MNVKSDAGRVAVACRRASTARPSKMTLLVSQRPSLRNTVISAGFPAAAWARNTSAKSIGRNESPYVTQERFLQRALVERQPQRARGAAQVVALVDEADAQPVARAAVVPSRYARIASPR